MHTLTLFILVVVYRHNLTKLVTLEFITQKIINAEVKIIAVLMSLDASK